MVRRTDTEGTSPDGRRLMDDGDADADDVHEISTGRHFVEDTKTERLSILEALWSRIRQDAERDIGREPTLSTYLTANVLRFHSFDEAVSEHLAEKLSEPTFPARAMKNHLVDGFGRSLALCTEVAEDFAALRGFVPAKEPHYATLLQHVGLRGLMTHRFATWLLYTERETLARYVAARAAVIFGQSIDLAARLEGGIVADGALRIDCGATVARGVTLADGVALLARDGSVPRLMEGARIGQHATVMGRVIGRHAWVLPSSVVLDDVPDEAVVGGCPARRVM